MTDIPLWPSPSEPSRFIDHAEHFVDHLTESLSLFGDIEWDRYITVFLVAPGEGESPDYHAVSWAMNGDGKICFSPRISDASCLGKGLGLFLREAVPEGVDRSKDACVVFALFEGDGVQFAITSNLGTFTDPLVAARVLEGGFDNISISLDDPEQ